MSHDDTQRLSESEMVTHRDAQYCKYLDLLSQNDCLGWESKVRAGEFGKDQLEAHCQAREHYGQYLGMTEGMDWSKQERDALKGKVQRTNDYMQCLGDMHIEDRGEIHELRRQIDVLRDDLGSLTASIAIKHKMLHTTYKHEYHLVEKLRAKHGLDEKGTET